VCFGVPYATHLWQVGDASSLNGVFKSELTRAKRDYIKHRSAPKFEPTDIVPLTNVAFNKSFGRPESVKKAIEKRGWNPLNYNLLTVIPFPDAIDLTGSNDGNDKENEPPAMKKININQGIGSFYVNLLIEEELKNEGRKKRNQEIKDEQKTKQQKIESIKKITKVSSTQLASHNHFTLDETVRDMVFERNAAAEAAHMATEQRKRAADLKKTEFLNNSLKKFSECPNGLTVPDLKAIITATTKASDSPVKKKKEELQQQLFCEPRYSRAKLLAEELRRTSNAEAAAALLAMVGFALFLFLFSCYPCCNVSQKILLLNISVH